MIADKSVLRQFIFEPKSDSAVFFVDLQTSVAGGVPCDCNCAYTRVDYVQHFLKFVDTQLLAANSECNSSVDSCER